jgi:predicted DCC family thiol-disulfide oxidoreductase YuxK
MVEAFLLYDEDCDFCTWIASLILRCHRKDELSPVAIQSETGRELLAGMDDKRARSSSHLVFPDGRIYSGGESLRPLLSYLPPIFSPLTLIPQQLTNAGYNLVAGYRSELSKLIPGTLKTRARRYVRARSTAATSTRSS